jgi:poly(A) polymerase
MGPPSPGDAPRLAGAEWLVRRETQAVFLALANAGYVARVVGGAVRNALMGRAVSDIDMATTAPPPAVIAAAKAAGIAAHPSGIDHGTVTLTVNHRPYEVTTLREDVETHGRHATVAFTDDWLQDARRRDFTINALYCDADGRLFDPLGGNADIAARRVRFIGAAEQRIAEDYLRILRFFRFTAEYAAGPPDSIGLAACVAGRDGLKLLSAERVRQEMLRLLLAARGPELVGWMAAYGLMLHFLPAVPRPGLLARLAALEAALGTEGDAVLRLAALAVEVAEDAVRLAERLRLSGAERAQLLRAAQATPHFGPSVPLRTARACLYREGAQAYRERLLIAWVRSGAPPSSAAWRERLALCESWLPPRLPIGGADVVALGVSPGPRVGALLRELEGWWIAGDFAAGEDALRARLADLVAASDSGGGR